MFFRQVSPGVYERPIGENETFIKILGDTGLPMGRENWVVTAIASFTPGPTINKDALELILRQAWIHLRYEQPSVATYSHADQIQYKVPDPQDLARWTSETFIVEDAGMTAADIIAGRVPSKYAKIHYIPSKSCLVLHSSHWRTDGIGIFHLLDVYFDLVCTVASGNGMADLEWGTEVSRLAPSIEQAARLSLDMEPELVETAKRLTATFQLVADSIGVEYRGSVDKPPGGTHLQQISFTSEQTQNIVNKCKSLNISVTAALHASVAAANYQFAAQESDRTKHYTSTVRFGLRKCLPSPFNTRDYGSALFTSGWMLRLSSEPTWRERAQAAHSEYRKGYKDVLPAHRQYARLLGEMLKTVPVPPSGTTTTTPPPPPPPPPPPSDLDISSIGIADKFISPVHKKGDVSVEIYRISLNVEILSRQMVCYVWTFRNVLNLQIAYNEAYHDVGQVKSILGYIRDTTIKELEI